MIRKMNLKLKWWWTDVCIKLGFPPAIKGKIGAVQVVVFHGICKDHEEYINGRFLKESVFRQLIIGMQNHFNVISLSDFMNKNLDTTKLNVLITFDDGYANNKELALPICEELKVPFMVFVCNRPFLWPDFFDILNKENPVKLIELTKFFEETSTFSIQELKSWIVLQKDEKLNKIYDFLDKSVSAEMREKHARFCQLLNDKDCEELAKNPYVSFGNHGANHLDFSQLSKEEIDDELAKVDNRMKEFLNYYSEAFVYPFGRYSDETRSYLNKKGYLQMSADGNSNSSPEMVDRLVINPYISINNQLIAIANGKY